MGFVAKSAFWLGMVYSAMPFDSGSPVALAPAAAEKPRADDSSLENIAKSVIPSLGQTPDRWKSAVEVAAALCAHNCFHPSPAGLSLIDARARTDQADPARQFSREKPGRQGAVRPPTANHIRSLDGQT
jgi:hypothetical protein